MPTGDARQPPTTLGDVGVRPPCCAPRPGTLLAAITGGTGRYRHARGQIVATDGPDGLINVVIQLSTE